MAMKWIQEHIKTFLAIVSATTVIISSAVGIFSYYQGVQAERQRNSLEIEALKHKQQQDYDYTMRILRASGAYYLPLED